MITVKIKHAPFGEPFILKDRLTEETVLHSTGMDYLQFCTQLGQLILHYGVVEVDMFYVPTNEKNSNQE